MEPPSLLLLLPCFVTPNHPLYHVLPFHITSYPILFVCCAMLYPVMLAIPYPGMPCSILVSILIVALSSSSMPCYVLPFILTHVSYGVIQIAGGHSACHEEHRGSCHGHVSLPQISSVQSAHSNYSTAVHSAEIHYTFPRCTILSCTMLY